MRWILISILILLAPSLAVASPQAFDYDDFGQVPVLQDGRLKPLDSLARVMIMRICGHPVCAHLSASQWLAFLFFKPSEAMQARMFSVASPQAAQMLGLVPRPDRLYSFEELGTVLPSRAAFVSALSQKDKNALDSDETEALRLYNATGDFAELIGTFSLALPLNGVDDTLRAQLHLPPGAAVSYLDVLKNRQALESDLREVMKRKGLGTDSYTRSERSLAQLVSMLTLQEQLDQDNAFVRVIPPAWGGEEWLSPWAVLKSSSGSPQSAQLLRDWRALADSYRAGDARGWQEMSRTLMRQGLSAMPPFSGFRLSLEYYYHRLGLQPLAAACYALGIALIAVGAAFTRARSLGRISLILGLSSHAVALAMRMLILLRPPVSTLYESLVFVSFVVMAVSVRLGRRNTGVLLAGASTALLLLLASEVFAGSSDTLGVLVAVLNTNFWLATHVVCITTGYGCALVAGVLAHLYLFRRAVLSAPEEMLAPLSILLHRTALLALFFTSIGTMLGGIWADQSWGRFWGWDPKENGALLIVLWLVWALHGRIAGQLGSFGFAVAMAWVNVIVGLAWIGVNLLSIGLHSYGFTDVAANGLLGFCALEAAYVAAMWLALRRCTHKQGCFVLPPPPARGRDGVGVTLNFPAEGYPFK